MNDLIDKLPKLGPGKSIPNTRPRDASTLILIDRTSEPRKVLLGRRHDSHAFMAGKFVFPGGRLERVDRRMPVATPLHPEVEARLVRRTKQESADHARMLALAAIRETFEETGLLLGVRTEGGAAPPDGPWRAFADAGIYPDLAQLHFIARAITPPRRARRFDTRFFAADANMVAHRIEGVVGPSSELVELVWVPIEEARKLNLPNITQVVLQELETRTAAGMRHDLPAPFYQMRHGRFVRELL